MTAPATIPPVGIPAGFATRLSWSLTGRAGDLWQAIQAVEDLAATAEPLDATICRAIGWQIEKRPVRRGRPPVWWARSPHASAWIALPRPTRDLDQTRRLVPQDWSWGCGHRNGQGHGWVSERHPIAEGVTWFECNGLSPELALTKAALFARRHLAARHEGLAA